MRCLSIGLLAVTLSQLSLIRPISAEEETSWNTRLSLDTVLRWAPRYVIEVDQTEWGADRLYWRRVDTIPLYMRVGLDTRWTHDDGIMSADIHTAAWAGLDLTIDTEEDGLVAGDFAVAYGRYSYKILSLWAGRRFVPWGPPGGLHLDGGGFDIRTRFGLTTEVIVGRPVTPVYDSLLGVQPSFEDATLAYGALLGYRHPGRISAAVAYSEQWAEGILADRLISAEITAVPQRRLDLRGSVVFDPAELAVEQAAAQFFVIATDWLELDVGYNYTDPTRLIARWSILAAFASGAFHEASLGTTWTLVSSHLLRAEGALRHYGVPGRNDVEGWYGYRADLVYRWVPRHRRFQVRAGGSQRGEDEAGLTIVHGAVSWAISQRYQLALEAAVSIDDDREKARDSYLARLTFEVGLPHDWYLGLTVDGARTAFVEAEIRGMLRASWRPQWGGAN